MLFDFLPDYVVSTYCRDGTGSMTPLAERRRSERLHAGRRRQVLVARLYLPAIQLSVCEYTGSYDASDRARVARAARLRPARRASIPAHCPGWRLSRRASPSWPSPTSRTHIGQLWPAPAAQRGAERALLRPAAHLRPARGFHRRELRADGCDAARRPGPGSGRPWASTITYVDLVNSLGTTPVYDGLWCNSDWSLGSRPTRRNAATTAEGGAASARSRLQTGRITRTHGRRPDGVPFHFVVSPSAGSATAQTYAAQKVTLMTVE